MTPRAENPHQVPALVLADELLESILDTIQLMVELRLGVRWQAHVEYLRALHRRGKAVLAAADSAGGTLTRSADSAGGPARRAFSTHEPRP